MNLKKTETNIPKNIFLCTLAVYFLLQGHLNIASTLERNAV